MIQPSPITDTFRRTLSGVGLYYGWFEAMHSRMDLLLVGVDPQQGQALCHAAAEETARVENLISRFDADSVVARMNADTEYGVCGADREVLDLFADAQRLEKLTEGAFDICVQTPQYDPSQPWFTVDYAREAVVKLRPEVQFDFGGLGKGYTLGRVRDIMERDGVKSALLSFGRSSIYALGHHPSGGAWQAGVDNPMCSGQQMGLFALCNQSLTSSGNTPSVSGHIRVPQTGELLQDRRIVSVVTSSPIEGEALSTALFAASDEQRSHIIERFGPCCARVMEYASNRFDALDLV